MASVTRSQWRALKSKLLGRSNLRMAWGRESSRRIADAPISAVPPWSLIWQGLGGRPWPRCSVAPGNLSDIDKPDSYGRVPHCMEFDSGSNGVRETSRTGLPWHYMANGDWHSFLVWSPSWHVDVSRQLKTKHQNRLILLQIVNCLNLYRAWHKIKLQSYLIQLIVLI